MPPRPLISATTRAAHAAEAVADVVVLGGGPAGAAAARLLAGWGRHVLLLARPHGHRSLAESLPPSAGKLLDHIGVSRAVEAAGFIRSTGNTVWWGAADARAERFGAGALGWQVARAAFDRVLLAEARRSGARVVRGAIVREANAGDGAEPGLVRYESRGHARFVRARWILDCTGRAGLMARAWRRADSSGRTLALVGVWERAGGWNMLEDDTHTLVESYEGGWAWSVPDSAQRRYVTVMVDPVVTAVRRAGGSAGLATIYREELAKATRLSELAQAGPVPARLVAPPFARDASSYSSARAAHHGALLVGDASSFVDPLSSYGIKKALASAWLASVVVHTALSEHTMTGAALELFETRERAMYEGLRRRFGELSRDAAAGRATEFWRLRAADDAAETGEPDVVELRRDPEVLTAFAEIRRRDSLTLRQSAEVNRVQRPTVRDDRVVLEEHLVVPAFRDGVRYVRNVDLVTLAALAPLHEQVPDLYAAYNRAAPPAPLPDFLGALSVLVGKRMLDLA